MHPVQRCRREGPLWQPLYPMQLWQQAQDFAWLPLQAPPCVRSVHLPASAPCPLLRRVRRFPAAVLPVPLLSAPVTASLPAAALSAASPLPRHVASAAEPADLETSWRMYRRRLPRWVAHLRSHSAERGRSANPSGGVRHFLYQSAETRLSSA